MQAESDRAIAVIDTYRPTAAEHTRLQEIDEEFPFLPAELGSKATYAVLDLTDNHAGTFKWRGAMYAAERASQDGAASLWTNSAGNHARGLILAARALNMPVEVRMPTTVPDNKRHAASQLWPDGQVATTLVGRDFNETTAYSDEQPGSGQLIHAFDDPDVISGQGTVVDDVLRLEPRTSDLCLPVGGGGLLAGVLMRLKSLGRSDINVHAVIAPGSDSLPRSLDRDFDDIVPATQPNRRYGGSCVSAVTKYAPDQCRAYPNVELHTVSDDEVERLINEYDTHRQDNHLESVPPYEPTTLVAIAGLMQIPSRRGGRVVALGTGRNAPLYPSRSVERATRVWVGQQRSS